MKARLIFDQDYLMTLLSFLDEAKKQIDVMAFSFAIGSASGKLNINTAPYEIAEKLKSIKLKFGKKITIRFFTEGLRETADRNKVTAHFLEECGIEIRYGSTHAKGFCVDGQQVFFGSTNLTQQSIMKNHEANIMINDKKTATQFTRYFDYLWNGGHHGGIKLLKPLVADGAFEEVIIKMIGRAKKKIEFSIYFFNHIGIEKALISAHERGVKVKGLIHQHNAFALSYVHANRKTLRKMKESGLKELYLGRPTLFSHSKYIAVDGEEVALGTGNWLVEDVHIHPQLYIHLKDPHLARGLARHLAFQIKSL